MPCIKIINSIKIYTYFRDHNPPHFHAIYGEWEELIEISNLETYAGALPKTQRKKVIQWASSNQDYLMRKWNDFNPNK